MLTPIDVHYLVGFLSHVGEPEAVELELGAMVTDDASESKRDIDVTLLRRSGEAIECYRGIEVKAEKRPLDVIAVEPLCIKLNDMPDLTHRAVVSASGYTDTGRRKAEKHGVELLRLDEWDRSTLQLGTSIPPDLKWTNRLLHWDSPRVDFRIDWQGGVQIPVNGSLKVADSSGRPMKHVRDLNALSRQVLEQCAADSSRKDPRVTAAEAGQRVHVTYQVTIDNEPRVRRGKKWGVVKGAHISGHLVWCRRTAPTAIQGPPQGSGRHALRRLPHCGTTQSQPGRARDSAHSGAADMLYGADQRQDQEQDLP